MQRISSPTTRAMIKTGTYTGNGADNRNINIGVALSLKANAWVIIRKNAAIRPYFRIEYGQGDLTMSYESEVDLADLIQMWTATGFQIGADARLNDVGVLFRYIAVWQEG